MPPLTTNEDCHDHVVPEYSLALDQKAFQSINAAAAAAASTNYLRKKSVSFDSTVSVISVPNLVSSTEIDRRWYSRRDLSVFKQKIRSLLRRHEEEQYLLELDLELEESKEELFLHSSSSSSSSFDEEEEDCLYGLERHMPTEKEIIRTQKYNAKLAVFSEQFIQRQQAFYDDARIGLVYAAYAAQCQQHAIRMALYNAMESARRHERERQEEEEAKKTAALMERQQETSLYLGESKKQGFSLANNFGSCWGWKF